MDEKNYKILIVDDEPDVLEFIGYNLRKEDFQIFVAKNGKDAIEIAQKIKPHLILLDIMMPDMDGIETCQEIRQIPSLEPTIIVFLTARGEDYSQIAGFEAGGDDYITKPVKPKVLISKIKALLKRQQFLVNTIQSEPVKVSKSGLIIDKERYVVIMDGKDMYLPKKEFELLALLISKPEKVFTREEIFKYIWGDKIIVGDRTIDVHIRKLREKIGDQHIITIKGVGYKFVE